MARNRPLTRHQLRQFLDEGQNVDIVGDEIVVEQRDEHFLAMEIDPINSSDFGSPEFLMRPRNSENSSGTDAPLALTSTPAFQHISANRGDFLRGPSVQQTARASFSRVRFRNIPDTDMVSLLGDDEQHRDIDLDNDLDEDELLGIESAHNGGNEQDEPEDNENGTQQKAGNRNNPERKNVGSIGSGTARRDIRHTRGGTNFARRNPAATGPHGGIPQHNFHPNFGHIPGQYPGQPSFGQPPYGIWPNYPSYPSHLAFGMPPPAPMAYPQMNYPPFGYPWPQFPPYGTAPSSSNSGSCPPCADHTGHFAMPSGSGGNKPQGPRATFSDLNAFSRLEATMILDKLPDLTGKEGSDRVRAFFRKFDLHTEGWTSAQRIRHLQAKVEGRAERALGAAMAFERTAARLSRRDLSYEAIRDEFISVLDDVDAKEAQAFDELFTGLNRRSRETIDQLAERVSGVVRRAYPGLKHELIDEYSIKHFIRALDNSDVALSLELARTPSMSFDQFVALASRAESTVKVVRNGQSRDTTQQFNSRDPNHRQQGFNSDSQRVGPTCYRCNNFGHTSRTCTAPISNGQGGQRFGTGNGSTQNSQDFRRNFGDSSASASGTNRIPLNQVQNWRQPPNFGNSDRAIGGNTQQKRANCIQVDEESKTDSVLAGGVCADPDVGQWLESLQDAKMCEEPDSSMPPSVGKLVTMDLFVSGRKGKAMLDGGAQVSLVSAPFLFRLVNEGIVALNDTNFGQSTMKVYDINGKQIIGHGVVALAVNRKDLPPVEATFHVSSAPFGFDFIVGTNNLGRLGMKLFDGITDRAIEFECMPAKESAVNEIRVVFNTRLQPWSTTWVQVSIAENCPVGKDLLVEPAPVIGPIRVDPSVVRPLGGEIAIPVCNFSSMPVTLQTGESIGLAAPAELMSEYESHDEKLSLSPFVCNMRAEERDPERTEKIRLAWQTASGELNGSERDQLGHLISEFEEIFALEDVELTQTELVTHHVETNGAAPIKKRMRPVPYAYREKVAAMLQDYLSRGIIRPSWSPYASPIVLVPKKDGTIRFCTDYRGLNAVTVKDAFPLPNIDNTLMMLANRKVFSTMDFMSGYWQIRMHPDSIEKSAFTTEFGLFEYLVMPFGMTNAVATFQRFMNRLFDGILNDFVFVYIDDILVASESFEQHLVHLRIVFERIKMASLKLKIAKCHFVAVELPFLGHVLTRVGVKKDADKIRPILDYPVPKTRKELHSFLGFMTYYRKFIYSFGKIAAPLFQLLRKDTAFALGQEQLEAFETLKTKIAEDVTLSFPDFKAAMNDPTRGFIMMTDASKIGISAVLCQPDSAHNVRPIYFASRQCSKAEGRYGPTELEALAIRFGAKKFAQFITMIRTRVLTDHRALVPMFKSNEETGNARVDKWIMELRSRFILQVEYNPGKSNIIADVLSRNFPNVFLPEGNPEDQVLLGAMRCEGEKADHTGEFLENRAEWQAKTRESELKELVSFLADRVLPEDPRQTQRIMAQVPFFTLVDRLLYKCDPKTGDLKLFVPPEFRRKLANDRHSGICGGHFSAKKLFLQLSERYFWPNMRADCAKLAMDCRVCAHTREPTANQPGIQMIRTTEPLELVCLDILDIGRSRARNRYVLVCVDHFSKWTTAVPVPDKSAETIARAFVESFILIFGAPKRIHSDRGKEFVNSTLAGIAKVLKTTLCTTSGYDPQANGLVERMNQTIIKALKRTTPSEWDWDLRLPFVVFAINVTPAAATGFSPFSLMFGRVVNFPTDESAVFDADPRYTVDQETYLQAFNENLVQILGDARKSADVAREGNRMEFNNRPNVTIGKFAVGDRVMLVVPGEKQKSRWKKLSWNHFGPYKIVEIAESTAKLVPCDAPETEPTQSPLERLIRVPPGVPDISILPKEKKKFKELMGTLRVGSVRIDSEQFEDHGELLSQLFIPDGTKFLGSIGTLNNSGPEDGDGQPKTQVDVISLGDALGWCTPCSGDGHELCVPVTVAEFDAMLDKHSGLGAKLVRTPLAALLSTFLIRQLKSSKLAHQMVTTIVESPGKEFFFFLIGRGNEIPSDAVPTTEQLREALEIRIRSCRRAYQLLERSGYNLIKLDGPALPFSEQQKAERPVWEQFFEQASWVLETVRAECVHRRQLIEKPRIVLGDCTARELVKFGEMTTVHLLAPEDNMTELIRQFDRLVLSSRVKAMLIVLGRKALLDNETLETIGEHFRRLRNICERYNHIAIIWAAPPYLHVRKMQHTELVVRLNNLLRDSPIKFAHTTDDGRSLGEVFRYGNSFAGLRVNQFGHLTDHGAKTMLAWLTTVAGFPGEDDLGKRQLRSQVVRVRPDPSASTRVRLGSGNRHAEDRRIGFANRRLSSSSDWRVGLADRRQGERPDYSRRDHRHDYSGIGTSGVSCRRPGESRSSSRHSSSYRAGPSSRR